MYSVRVAKAADVKKLARVQVKRWRVTYRGHGSNTDLDKQTVTRREAYWRGRFEQPGGSVFIVERDGVLGFCDFTPARDKDLDAKMAGEIAAVYVISDDLRMGAGKVLCCHALTQARKQGRKAVILWLQASNSGAMRFFESLGFIRDGTVKIAAASDGTRLHEIRYRIQFDRAGQTAATSGTAIGA